MPVSPYANIDWEKAKVLFQQPTKTSKGDKGFLKVRDILRILTIAGSIGFLFAFPGAGAAIGALVLADKEYSRWEVKRVVNRLKKQKWVDVDYLPNGQVKVTITKDGLVKALTYELDAMEINKPRKWDRKWRVVIFDIPNKYKRVRDIFRMRLHQLSLYQLQESVYVSPYPCYDEVEFLRQIYGVPFKVRYLLVEKIEDDESLLSHFDLEN